MREEIYYFVSEEWEEPVLFVVLNGNEKIACYTKSEKHWLNTQGFEQVSLNSVLADLAAAIENGKRLTDFQKLMMEKYAQANWRKFFVSELFAKKLSPIFSDTVIVEKINPERDAYFKALLVNLSNTGFAKGLSKVEDPEVYFAEEDAVRVVDNFEENDVNEVEGTVDFPLEVEDLFMQLRADSELYEEFTEIRFRQEIILYLQDKHRDETVDFIRSNDRELFEERGDDFVFNQLISERNSEILERLAAETRLAMIEVVENAKEDIAEEVGLSKDMTAMELFSYLEKHSYFEEFKEDYEFEIERQLYDMYREEVHEVLMEICAIEIKEAFDELVFDEMILDKWKKFAEEKANIFVNAVKNAIAENLEEVEIMLD